MKDVQNILTFYQNQAYLYRQLTRKKPMLFAAPVKFQIVGPILELYEMDDQFQPLPYFYGKQELRDEVTIW